MNYEQYSRALKRHDLPTPMIKLEHGFDDDGWGTWTFRYWPMVPSYSGRDFSQVVTINRIDNNKWRVEWSYNLSSGRATFQTFMQAYMFGDIIAKRRRKMEEDEYAYACKVQQERDDFKERMHEAVRRADTLRDAKIIARRRLLILSAITLVSAALIIVNLLF